MYGWIYYIYKYIYIYIYIHGNLKKNVEMFSLQF